MWRMCILGLTTAFWLVLASVHGVAATQPAQCLQYDDQYTNRVVINLATGVQSGGETTKAIKAAVAGTFESPRTQLSPDGKYVAIQYTTSDEATVFGLMPAYTVEAPLNLSNAANDGFRHFEVTWSPDSQWLSYLSDRGDDGYYLSVMDAAGITKYEQFISTRHEDWISSFGWSADGLYLAISVSDAMGGPLRKIEIWSVPELKLAKLIKPQDAHDSPRYYGNPDISDRIQWSTNGHLLAYLHHLVTGMDDLFTLNFYTPEQDKPTTYDLPYLTDTYNKAGIAMSWSPNGQYIAVISTLYSHEQIGRIGVYGIDGSIAETVSEKVMSDRILSDGGIGFPQAFWSEDGHALLFVEELSHHVQDVGTLVAYIAVTKQTVQIHPYIHMNPGTQDHNRYLFARAPQEAHSQDPDKDSLVVVDTNTLAVTSVPALRENNDARQVYGDMSEQSGWLFLSEDELTTWAINTKTGDQFPFYAPHEIATHRKYVPGYLPLPASEYVLKEEVDSIGREEVSILLLRDHSIRKIARTFDGFVFTGSVSPDGELFAAMVTDSTGEHYSFEVMKADGSIVGKFDLEKGNPVINLKLTTCD